MLKQFITLIMLLAVMAQTCRRVFIVFDYYINTSVYASNCENKSRPKMHCNGKCQMMKKLKQEENKEDKNPERKAENKDEVIASGSFFATLNTPLAPTTTTSYFNRNDTRIINRSRTLFHPPSI